MATKTPKLADTLRDAGTLDALRQLAGRLASAVDAASDPYDVAKLSGELRLTLSLIAKCESARPASAPAVSNPVDELMKKRLRVQRRAGRPVGGTSA